jgi:hypothetical protein
MRLGKVLTLGNESSAFATVLFLGFAVSLSVDFGRFFMPMQCICNVFSRHLGAQT